MSHNEGGRLRTTVDALLDTTHADVEIVVVDDFSTDDSADFLAGPRAAHRPRVQLVRPPHRSGVAGARNFGAHAVLADLDAGDLLVFSDAHVLPSSGWLEPLQAAVADGAAAVAPAVRPMADAGRPGYGFTWRDASLTTSWLAQRPPPDGEVPMLCGCFLAVERSAFDETGGFDAGLVTWGLEDAELSMRLWRSGRRCVVAPDSEVRHLFRPQFPYAVNWRTTLYNILRFAVIHFSDVALTRVVEHFADNAALPQAYARVLDSDAWARRSDLAATFVRDGGWFFERFGIEALQ